MIPFSPPRIDDKVIDAVSEVLRSGWITTGPKTKLFEKQITNYVDSKCTIAVNSWTMGMHVFLHWWGIGEGDEVIIPAYTYCATANTIIHAGATPVMVDCDPSGFNLSIPAVREAITERTKAIVAVDIAGFPCSYNEINDLVKEEQIKAKFHAATDVQKKLGRIIVISDAAHSFVAQMNGQRTGSLTDVSIFSFHAVKNLTTAEGGAISFNLPDSFDHESIYRQFSAKILHGQSKDALAKTVNGNWRYDVEEPGFKCNMTDIQAAIGLVELERYQENLDRRKYIFEMYDRFFSNESWADCPIHTTTDKTTSYHLYQLRIKGIDEEQRDLIIQKITEKGVSVNVHFIPLPLLTAYRNRGFKMENYPEAYAKFKNEVSLPVYYNLTDEEVQIVCQAVKEAAEHVLGRQNY
jgi:dTDP-4-amino-4,6-dideoxygalactose transaminase